MSCTAAIVSTSLPRRETSGHNSRIPLATAATISAMLFCKNDDTPSLLKVPSLVSGFLDFRNRLFYQRQKVYGILPFHSFFQSLFALRLAASRTRVEESRIKAETRVGSHARPLGSRAGNPDH